MNKTSTIIFGLFIFAGIFFRFGVLSGIAGGFVNGGGGMELNAPDTIKTDEPTDIDLIVTATGGGGAIKGRYTNISFHYRLMGEKSYQELRPQPMSLPENFLKVQSQTFQSEAYKFTIPPYPKGTNGEIDYYTEITFDGYPSKDAGVKKIKVSDDAKSSFDLKNNLSPIKICGRNFKIDIITLEGMPVTNRIAALIDQESANSTVKGNATFCDALQKLPEYSTLTSKIEDYDGKKMQYLATLQFPFVIDLKVNKIYKVKNPGNTLGDVFGNLR